MTQLHPRQLERVAHSLRAAGEHVAGPLEADVIAGGRSNITLRITDGSTSWVLRKPPPHGLTPSAHDVGREFRVTAALRSSDVPVPTALVLEEDPGVLGAPFAVWSFVPGRVLSTHAHLQDLPRTAVGAAVEQLLASLATLHQIDPAVVGLADLGRPTGYATRQLRRWAGQWDLVGPAGLNPLAQEIIYKLNSRIPPETGTSLLHGDFRIDNVLIDQLPTHPVISAVLDWELSTLGDPVADVAMMCAYRHPAFDHIVGEPSAWACDLVPGGDDLASGYVTAGGRPLSNWAFHLTLAHLKIAVIAAGIDHRYRAGSGVGSGFNSAGRAVAPFIEKAHQLAQTIP